MKCFLGVAPLASDFSSHLVRLLEGYFYTKDWDGLCDESGVQVVENMMLRYVRCSQLYRLNSRSSSSTISRTA
jgi:hypothetical protein